jgi:hypothetical protein
MRWWAPSTPTIPSRRDPEDGHHAGDRKGIWIDQTITTYDQWLGNGSSDAINVYTRADASGAGEMWARFAGGTAQEELRGIAVNADPGLAEAVRQDKLGVGYNNIGFAYDLTTGAPVTGLRVIPIDLNGNGAIDPDEDFYAAKARNRRRDQAPRLSLPAGARTLSGHQRRSQPGDPGILSLDFDRRPAVCRPGWATCR